MKKFDGVLFCTDLDGTLLLPDKTVSRENLDAIEYFMSEGGAFTFVTGRMPVGAVDVYETVDPNVPFGCINGGGIFDHKKCEFLWMESLPDKACELVRYVDEKMPEIGIQYNTAKAVYFNKYNPAMVHFREVTGLPAISCHYSEVKEPVAKIIFAHDDETELFKLIDLLTSHPLATEFDFIRSEHDLYEILPKGISKATALIKLAELLRIDINKTIAIGDYDNDVSMIRAAGLGIAVANACDAAKAAADHVTVSNTEHAIARVIDELERGILKL